jgi:hypothetical protein
MDLSTFRGAFPEFNTADDTLVKSWLTLAAAEIDQGAFGASYDTAHGLLTAHRLALSPAGKNARLVSNQGQTTYKKQFDELRHTAGAGLGRVI